MTAYAELPQQLLTSVAGVAVVKLSREDRTFDISSKMGGNGGRAFCGN